MSGELLNNSILFKTSDRLDDLGSFILDGDLNIILSGALNISLVTPTCTLKTPTVAPTPGQILKTDISGNLSWFDNPNIQYRDQMVSYWESGNLTDSNRWNSVTWSPQLGLFCAVGFSGSQRVATSPNGTTWTLRTSANDGFEWFGICWSPELGLFCAVSNSGTLTGTDVIMTSPDGITWTTQTNPPSLLNDVTWSPELGIFCTVGNSTILTSPDGVTWTSRSTINGTRITWSPQLGIFCGIDNNNSFTSPDGITWTSYVAFGTSLSGLTWSPQLGIFCAVSFFGIVYTSIDGITWTNTTRIQELNEGVYNISWSCELELFCVVGGRGNEVVGNFYNCATSPDAVVWSERSMPGDNISSTSDNWRSVTWSPELGVFCAVNGTSEAGIPRSAITLR